MAGDNPKSFLTVVNGGFGEEERAPEQGFDLALGVLTKAVLKVATSPAAGKEQVPTDRPDAD